MNRGQISVLSVLALMSVSCLGQTAQIGVDLRVELMSILFRLARNPEYNMPAVPAYTKAIEAHFAPVRNHPAVLLAKQLRESNDVGYDAVMSLAIHLEDAFLLKERIDFEGPNLPLASRWKGTVARPFLAAARRFVIDGRFREFVVSQQPLYDETNARLRRFVDSGATLSWFDPYFGVAPGAQFVLVPAPGNGRGNYGPSFRSGKGADELWAILGLHAVDSAGLPTIDDRRLPLIVHEFSHSYVNPVAMRFLPKIEGSGPAIYQRFQTDMNRQAYGQWQSVFYESLVRAVTARYLLKHSGEQAARLELQDQLARSFLWTGELFEMLDEYEKHRDRYPTFEAYMPRIVDYFNALPPRLAELTRRYEALRPSIVSMSPVNGSEAVDPSLTELVFRFNRPMVKPEPESIIAASDETYPKIDSFAFDDSGKVFTIRARLEPNRLYEFDLNGNGPTGGSFKTENGVRLKPYKVRFRTGATH